MSALTVSDNLLAYVKRQIDVSWDDDDEKIREQIRRGMAYIIAKTGVEASTFDGDTPNDRALELLINYVLYDRSGAVNSFKENYKSDIIGLRLLWEVSNYEASSKD